MQARYEGLCALVHKEGACWQCAGLREGSPETRRGPDVPDKLDWTERLQTVRDAALDAGGSHAMHDLFFRRTLEQEEEGRGDDDASTDCGTGG
jgi:RNA polymerase sigma-70 factor (ECF subfamily)